MWFFRYASVQTDILCTLSDGEVIDVDLTARADQSEDLSRGPLPLAYKRFMPPLGTKSTRSPPAALLRMTSLQWIMMTRRQRCRGATITA